MSSEPGNESFFCALRPMPRILSLRRRHETNQVKFCKPSRRKTISGCSCPPDANRYGARWRWSTTATSDLNWRKGSALVRVVGRPEVIHLHEKSPYELLRPRIA